MADAKTSTNPSVVSKAAQALGKSYPNVRKVLAPLGISDDHEGWRLLKAKTTTSQYLEDVLRKSFPKVPELKILAAAAILKGEDPFAEEEKAEGHKKVEPVVVNSSVTSSDTSAILEIIKENRTPAQMKDRELLELYAK